MHPSHLHIISQTKGLFAKPGWQVSSFVSFNYTVSEITYSRQGWK